MVIARAQAGKSIVLGKRALRDKAHRSGTAFAIYSPPASRRMFFALSILKERD
jgi:hypothetical protein